MMKQVVKEFLLLALFEERLLTDNMISYCCVINVEEKRNVKPAHS